MAGPERRADQLDPAAALPGLPSAPLPGLSASAGHDPAAHAGDAAADPGQSAVDALASASASAHPDRGPAHVAAAPAGCLAAADAHALRRLPRAHTVPVLAVPTAPGSRTGAHALAHLAKWRRPASDPAAEPAPHAVRLWGGQALVAQATTALPPEPRRPLSWALAALLLVSATLSAASGERAALINAGNTAFKAKDYAAAAKAFYQASVLKPEDPVTLYGVAACEFLQGRTVTAKAWGELSLTRDPQAPKTLDLMQRLGLEAALIEAIQARQGGQAAAALLRLEAVPAPARSALWWRTRCAALIDLERLEEAEQALEQARALGPKNFDLKALNARFEQAFMALLQREDPYSYQTRLGLQAFRQGDYRGARGPLQKATELGPQEASAWYNLAMDEWQLGDANATREALQRCLDLDPQHEGGLYLKAAYLTKAAQGEQARAVLTTLAQGSDAGWAGLAVRELAAKAGPTTSASDQAIAWHLYLRAVGGPSTTATHDGVSETVTPGIGSQDYLRMSGEAWALPVLWLSGAFSAYVTPSKADGADWALGEPYHALDLDARWQPLSWGALTGGYTGALRHGSGIVTYTSHSGRLGVDVKGAGFDSVALVGSVQSERYPNYPDFDATSAGGSLSATLSDARGDGLVLSGSGRQSRMSNELWSTRYAVGALTLRLSGPWSTQWTLFGSVQPTVYPNFSDGNGGQRFDRNLYGSSELSFPIAFGIHGLVGGQWSDTSSNLSYYGSRSTLGFAGLWTWL